MQIGKDGPETFIVFSCDRCGQRSKRMPNDKYVQTEPLAVEAGFAVVRAAGKVQRHLCRMCRQMNLFGGAL